MKRNYEGFVRLYDFVEEARLDEEFLQYRVRDIVSEFEEYAVEVEDSNALNPEAEPDAKIDCPGVGMVIDEDLELAQITEGHDGDDDDREVLRWEEQRREDRT